MAIGTSTVACRVETIAAPVKSNGGRRVDFDHRRAPVQLDVETEDAVDRREAGLGIGGIGRRIDREDRAIQLARDALGHLHRHPQVVALEEDEAHHQLQEHERHQQDGEGAPEQAAGQECRGRHPRRLALPPSAGKPGTRGLPFRASPAEWTPR